eukprot:CAMPEP_0172593284 /NCGR_PEP_ID=MMETSP1068-20121228/12458_1 /TAXON_ID=35684 /ORGANISM="Pseudopedinella elastica, Strain CCMP716" /LENGTH=1075 /DNA_ID=CAMNT_0013390733 /DNA_START=147 /DNA_END=3374 /DNA_ORIENTATION=+
MDSYLTRSQNIRLPGLSGGQLARITLKNKQVRSLVQHIRSSYIPRWAMIFCAVVCVSQLAIETKGVLLQSVFGGAKSTGGAEGCAVPGFPEDEACLKARAQQLTLAALYSHAAVAHGLSCALDVLIFCQTRLLLKRRVTACMIVIHIASTTTYALGSTLGAQSPEWSLPFRNLEWCVTVPMLTFVISGISFQSDTHLVWDASLLAVVMISSGSLGWWYLWPWLDPVSGVPSPPGLSLAAFLGPGVLRLGVCGVLSLVTLVTYGWLLVMISNFLIYSEAFVDRKNLAGSKKAMIYYRPFMYAVIVLWSTYPLVRLARLFDLIGPVAENIGLTFLDFNAKLAFCFEVLFMDENMWVEMEFLRQELREQRNTGVKKFIRFVFHEVRVPFNSLWLALECLEDNAQRTDEDRELINMMKDNAHSMKRIINDVLSFQKLQEGHIKLAPRPMRLWPNLAHLVATWQQQQQASHIMLGATCPDDDPLRDVMVFADSTRMNQVLSNLISNGCKFTPEGGRVLVAMQTLEIFGGNDVTNFEVPGMAGRSRLGARQAVVRFTVTDSGPGVKPEARGRIFEQFSVLRGHNTVESGERGLSAGDPNAGGAQQPSGVPGGGGGAQEVSGTGIGLWLCKELVQVMGGNIGIEGPEEGGSRFWFEVVVGLDQESALRRETSGFAGAEGLSAIPLSAARAASQNFSETRMPSSSSSSSEEDTEVATVTGSALRKDGSSKTSKRKEKGGADVTGLGPLEQLLNKSTNQHATEPTALPAASQNGAAAATAAAAGAGSSNGYAFDEAGFSHSRGPNLVFSTGPPSLAANSLVGWPEKAERAKCSSNRTNAPDVFASSSSQHASEDPEPEGRPPPAVRQASKLPVQAVQQAAPQAFSFDPTAWRPLGSAAGGVDEGALQVATDEVKPFLARCRFLVVDDSISHRKVTARTLTHMGVGFVTTAEDGLKGVEACLNAEKSGESFTVVLMDYTMPNCNGAEAVRRIRAAGCQVAVIGLTGNALDDDTRLMIDAGCEVVLKKPTSREELRGHLKLFFKRHWVDIPESRLLPLPTSPEVGEKRKASNRAAGESAEKQGRPM